MFYCVNFFPAAVAIVAVAVAFNTTLLGVQEKKNFDTKTNTEIGMYSTHTYIQTFILSVRTGKKVYKIHIFFLSLQKFLSVDVREPTRAIQTRKREKIPTDTES